MCVWLGKHCKSLRKRRKSHKNRLLLLILASQYHLTGSFAPSKGQKCCESCKCLNAGYCTEPPHRQMHTSGLYQIIPRSKVVFSVRQYTPASCLIWQSYHAELAFKTNRHYFLIVSDERPQSEYIMAESAVSLSCYCFIYCIIEISHENSNYLHPDRFRASGNM